LKGGSESFFEPGGFTVEIAGDPSPEGIRKVLVEMRLCELTGHPDT
jgi:hypothetical protein